MFEMQTYKKPHKNVLHFFFVLFVPKVASKNNPSASLKWRESEEGSKIKYF